MSVYHRKCTISGWVAVCLIGIAGCATVPKEAVSLSYAVGEDLQQLYVGYRTTVQFSFEQMRQNGLLVIDEIWTPAYLKTFVVEGELIEIAEEENWEDLQGWARAAIEDIDNKRKEFLDSLKTREESLLAKIDTAFSRVISANAAVTAHLNSVLKVQNLQDQILEAAGLKDIRDDINDAIVDASEFAEKAANDIRAASVLLEKKAEDTQ